jgi:hypothetical protein
MSVSVQDRCTVCAELPYAWKSFWTQTMELLGDVDRVESHYGLFGDSVTVGLFGDSGNPGAR